MNASSSGGGTPGRDRRAFRPGDRSKVSILHIFRSAHYAKDARREKGKGADGETEITQRSKQRREGMSEDMLKLHLQIDLNALLNTIRLEAAVPLDDAPHVARSVANYGFRDLSEVSPSDVRSPRFIASIRQSLLDHEPRLVPESVEVRVAETGEDDNRQRLALSVSAELMGDPVDIPIDFDAEVDLSAGKLRMSNLRVQS